MSSCLCPHLISSYWRYLSLFYFPPSKKKKQQQQKRTEAFNEAFNLEPRLASYWLQPWYVCSVSMVHEHTTIAKLSILECCYCHLLNTDTCSLWTALLVVMKSPMDARNNFFFLIVIISLVISRHRLQTLFWQLVTWNHTNLTSI